MKQEIFDNLSRTAQEQYLLQQEILDGKFGPPDTPFLTTRSLAEQRQVSLVTAHNILVGLCEGGYVQLRGKRYYLSHAQLMEDRKCQSNIIGMLVPHLNNEFFSSLSDAVVESLRQKGYETLVVSATYSPDEVAKILQLFQNLSVAGIVSCVPTTIALYRNISVPCVFLGHSLDNSKCSSVQVNSFAISQKVARHLMKQGYREFMYIGTRNCSLANDIRFIGFQMQLKQNGFDLSPANTLQVSHESHADDGLLMEQLEQHTNPVGIFCYHDLIAAQLYRICKALGKRIPQDVGIVGFDDLSVATTLTPPLTTVQYRIGSMADMTAKLLLDNIQSRNTPYDNYYVEPNLVIRKSTDLRGSRS